MIPLTQALVSNNPCAGIVVGGDTSVRYRSPYEVPKIDVCPKCLRPVHLHAFEAGEMIVTTGHCYEHGDVVPVRRSVCNPPLED